MISGDIDFVHKLRELKAAGYTICLIQNHQVREELRDVAQHCIEWRSLQPLSRKTSAAPPKEKKNKMRGGRRPKQQPSSTICCEDCARTFDSIQALAQHQKETGHGGDWYECLECGRVFATDEALKQHQIVTGHTTASGVDPDSVSSSSEEDIVPATASPGSGPVVSFEWPSYPSQPPTISPPSTQDYPPQLGNTYPAPSIPQSYPTQTFTTPAPHGYPAQQSYSIQPKLTYRQLSDSEQQPETNRILFKRSFQFTKFWDNDTKSMWMLGRSIVSIYRVEPPLGYFRFSPFGFHSLRVLTRLQVG